MAITKVFRSGNSQAVRIPKQLQFRSQRVETSSAATRSFCANSLPIFPPPSTFLPASPLTSSRAGAASLNWISAQNSNAVSSRHQHLYLHCESQASRRSGAAPTLESGRRRHVRHHLSGAGLWGLQEPAPRVKSSAYSRIRAAHPRCFPWTPKPAGTTANCGRNSKRKARRSGPTIC